MDRYDKDSQPNYPQNMHYSFKRKHDATILTPNISTDLLRPANRQRVDNGQEGQGYATATMTPNAGTDGSHVRYRGDQLDMSVGEREESEPVVVTGTRGSHTQAQVHNASHIQSPHAAAAADIRQTNAFFQDAHGFNISGNSSFHNQNIGRVTNNYGRETDGLQNLNGFISFDAQFDSSAQDPDRQCHPGTRKNVLKRLRYWIDNPNPTERIFWLYGPAGAGKSAIAQTIARSYDRPKVAGTFFFFRSDVNRNDGNRLFTTLAYQLAFSMPEIKSYITDSLSERPDLPMADVEAQFNQLLARPFQNLLNVSTQQLTPAVHVIIDIVKKYQELAPVIIIDGVDECTDEKLQRRFLKIIGDAVADDHFLLRFLIVSRPELHIEQTIRRFQPPILTIDLAELDDANKDIEKYLVDEFSRIASEQDLDPTWPGPEIIRDIVYKSSGNFILPSVIIRFVGDPDNFAETQLDIVRNLKPPTTMTPFAVLDQLFLEILRRVPDQDFLKRYLALLTTRMAVSSDYGELYKDDAVLMHVCEKELHAKLRKMRSLLRLEYPIDVHHRSFIDFLHDSSRSSQYHISKGEIRQYLELFVDSLVRYASAVIEQPDRHNAPHFNPRFRVNIETFPPKITLPANEWQKVTRPLLDLQNKLLQLPNFAPCDECTVFHLLRELLHLGLYLGIFMRQRSDPFILSVMDEQRCRVVSLTTTTTEKWMGGNDLDSITISLLAHLPEIMENWSPNEEVFKLMSAILDFDSAEVARSVRFVSHAQKLVDLLVYMIRSNNALSRVHSDAMRKAVLLALDIFARAPVLLPLSFLLDKHDVCFLYTWSNGTLPIQILTQTIFASWILDRYYVGTMLGGYIAECNSLSFCGDMEMDSSSMTMAQWRQTEVPVSATVQQMMLKLAKVIQYFHSLDVVLYRVFGLDDVLLDFSLRPKVCCWCSTSPLLLDPQCKGWFSPEENIFSFGCIFYEMFSGFDTKSSSPSEERRHIITQRRCVPGIPEYAWQLIQCCCAQYPGSRPSVDEIVQEMESWEIK